MEGHALDITGSFSNKAISELARVGPITDAVAGFWPLVTAGFPTPAVKTGFWTVWTIRALPLPLRRIKNFEGNLPLSHMLLPGGKQSGFLKSKQQ